MDHQRNQGKPLGQVKVQLYSPTGQLVKEATTDEWGLALITLSVQDHKKLSERPPNTCRDGFYAGSTER